MGKRNISLERAECPLCNGIQLVMLLTQMSEQIRQGTESRTVTSLHNYLNNKAQPCKCAEYQMPLLFQHIIENKECT